MTSPHLYRMAANADALMAQADFWQRQWVGKNRVLSTLDEDPFNDMPGAYCERNRIATEADHAARQLEGMGVKPLPAFGDRANALMAQECAA